MAIIHRAEIEPTKLEVLQAFVPAQPWHDGSDPAAFEVLGGYRFDDPDGAVGIETHLVRTASGAVLQVPLTYRDAPLDGVDIVTTMQHSVLGPRWVYDGCADPVCVSAFVRTIRTGGTQAEFEFPDGAVRPPTTFVIGSGGSDAATVVDAAAPTSDERSTVVALGGEEFVLLRVVDVTVLDGDVLTGTWPGHDQPTVLAGVRAAR